MKYHSQLSGFKEMNKLLTELPKRVEHKVLQQAVSAAAREGQKAIKQRTPVHDGVQSEKSRQYGPGRKNIKVRAWKKAGVGRRGAQIHTGDSFWLLFYELGTRFQPARPFFAKAFKESYDKMVNTLAQRLRSGIEKESVKLRKIN